MPTTSVFSIVDTANRCLWQRRDDAFSAEQALAAFAALQRRFPVMRLFLFVHDTDPHGRLRRRLLANPNLKATTLVQAGALAGDADDGEAAPVDLRTEPPRPAGVDGLLEIELWHRRPLIRHLNYPGLSFATEAPSHVARADYERVAELLSPAQRPLNTVFRLSQNSDQPWMPGEDRKSTSIGDIIVVRGRDGAPDVYWMVMAMGFEEVDRFD